MLPPRMREIYVRLSRKSSSDLTREEKELLQELRELDESALSKRMFMERIVAGPSDSCSCCGQPL